MTVELSPLQWQFAAGLVAAALVYLLFPWVVQGITRRTASDLDDILVARLRGPLAWTLAVVATWYALPELALDPSWMWAAQGVLATTTVLLWTVAVAGTSRALLDWLVTHRQRYPSIVTDRTLPVFDIAAKTFLWGGSIYFVFLAWEVDLTGWLASAGVVGVAVGFAAKDTLSNLIAGVFILADAPYKLGDTLVLTGGERGVVVEIGIRTTRIRTRDDVEIIVPNSLMANSTIINQSGGPALKPRLRVRVPVSVAYGTDVARVRTITEAIAQEDGLVLGDPAPRLRFRALADSGLAFELLVWVADPNDRGLVVDRMLTSIYERFQRDGIEIPYPKRDLIVRTVDGQGSGLIPNNRPT